MSNTATIKELSDHAGDWIREAFHAGMEAGLRRMTARTSTLGVDEYLLHTAIREIDAEFDFPCPCVRFVEYQCQRCGKADPLLAKES